MLDTMIAYLWPEAMTQYTVVGREATTADPTARPQLIFETADGYITVGTISDSEWQGFCAASERSGLAGSAVQHSRRLGGQRHRADPADGGNHQGARPPNAATARHKRCSRQPVLRRGEVIANEQVVARKIAEFDHPTSAASAPPNPRLASIGREFEGLRASASTARSFWRIWGSSGRDRATAAEKVVRLVKPDHASSRPPVFTPTAAAWRLCSIPNTFSGNRGRTLVASLCQEQVGKSHLNTSATGEPKGGRRRPRGSVAALPDDRPCCGRGCVCGGAG